MSRSPLAIVPKAPVWYRVPNNLPSQATPLVGRRRELDTALRLMQREDTRLLTVVGPPGVGKTRIALQLARECLNDFSDGVYFLPLASINDPSLVAPAMMRILGIKETGSQPLTDALKQNLRDKQSLLLLDNFEQLLDAAYLVGELLGACPQVKIIVTSRSTLHIYGELEFQVPPMRLPEPARLSSIPVQVLSHYEAVELFLQRAQRVRHGFQLTPQNARAVAEICVELDGLPLAIELAATRIKLLPAKALLAHLEPRLQLLTGGAQDLHPRQQTLRNTIEWSYDLLNPEEQRLFRKLAVFSGGWTLDAIDEVCEISREGALEDLSSLIDQSLIIRDDQSTEELAVARTEEESAASGEPETGEREPRFRMLATIREYALERLAVAGEEDAMRQSHATYYLSLATEASAQLRGPAAMQWLSKLEEEHNNMCAALGWLLEGGGTEAELALSLANALAGFWRIRGYLGEGRQWLERSTCKGTEASASLRAAAHLEEGQLAGLQNDHARAQELYDDSLALFREAGDKPGISRALGYLAALAESGHEYERAVELYEQKLAYLEEIGDEQGIALTLVNLSIADTLLGNYEHATILCKQGLALFHKLEDKSGIVQSLIACINLAMLQADYDRANALCAEAIGHARELDDKALVALALSRLGEAAILRCDYRQAETALQECLAMSRALGDRQRTSRLLAGLAVAVASLGERDCALQLCLESSGLAVEMGALHDIAFSLTGWALVLETGQGRGLREAARRSALLLTAASKLDKNPVEEWEPLARELYRRAEECALACLGAEEVEAARTKGRALSVEGAIDLARSPLPDGAHADALAERATLVSTQPFEVTALAMSAEKLGGLTRRERDVASLLAQGMSNKAMAERLVVSERTVESHVANALHKLGLASRAQLAVWAAQQMNAEC